MIGEEADLGNAPPTETPAQTPTLLFLLGVAVLRGGVTAFTLALFGVTLQALLFGVSWGRLGSEALFDLFLAFFVAAPAAAAESLALRRGVQRVWLAAIGIALVAFLGATAAFLQVQYAEAVLRTGSLAAGVSALVTGAGWVTVYAHLGGLFVSIALVFGLISFGRLEGLELEGQLRFTLVGALGAGVVLALTGAQGPQRTMSGLMILLTALTLPLLYRGCDNLERRLRERRAG